MSISRNNFAPDKSTDLDSIEESIRNLFLTSTTTTESTGLTEITETTQINVQKSYELLANLVENLSIAEREILLKPPITLPDNLSENFYTLHEIMMKDKNWHSFVLSQLKNFFQCMPNEIIQYILKYLNIDSYIKIKMVFNHRLQDNFYNLHGFFKSYECHKNFKLDSLILSPNHITASHVRAGNHLVLESLEKIKKGLLNEAEPLLKKAMYRYGSHYAMDFLKIISTLPGRMSLPYEIDELISIYEKESTKVLFNEFKLHVPDSDHAGFSDDITSMRVLLSEKIFAVYHRLAQFYREHHGLSTANAAAFLAQVNTYLDDLYSEVRRPKYLMNKEKYNAAGYIGYLPSDNKRNWFEKTPEHLKFFKMEKDIDNELNRQLDNLTKTNKRLCILK